MSPDPQFHVKETGPRREIEVWATREQVEEMALAHGDVVGLQFPQIPQI